MLPSAGNPNPPGWAAFKLWVQQESGWDPNAKSGNTNHGLPNYGLFQFFAGHPWAHPGMSVSDQARMACTQFNLTPARIEGFAAQIRAGNYPGWG
jgi:hypothetical protein